MENDEQSIKNAQRYAIFNDFISKTDRKSIYGQIKGLVARAQNVANKELNERRMALQKLLEYEDTIYEQEFANKVKSRIDDDIKERNRALLKIKEESSRQEQNFLRAKRVYQYMESCYEVREALRKKELRNVKECQLEQMLEKERAIVRQRDLDNYWLQVQKMNLDIADRQEKDAEKLKQCMVKQRMAVLDMQVAEIEAKREQIRKEKLEDKKKLEALKEEIRLEEMSSKHKGIPVKNIEYQKDLLNMIAEKKVIKDKEEMEKAKEHLAMIAECKRLDEEDERLLRERKKAFYCATMDYIAYVKRMKQLDEYRERLYSDRIDDLRHVDVCTKSNYALEQQRKAKLAADCYSVVRQQMCEQYEKRLRDQAEQRECKILENRFVRNEKTREEILAQRRQNRIDLDNQIAENKRIREEEESKFYESLLKASNDPIFCDELAKRYIEDGSDYLDPHPNWRIFVCPTKIYVPKPPAKDETELAGGSSGPRRQCGQSCALRDPGVYHCPAYKRSTYSDGTS